jgi:hypothetical protein
VERQPDTRRLLGAVADALTACEQAGIAVKLRHGIVLTRAGYVLPVGDHEWGARTLRYTPFSDGSEEED